MNGLPAVCQGTKGERDSFPFHFIGQNTGNSCYYAASFSCNFFSAVFAERITVDLLLPSILAISRYV